MLSDFTSDRAVEQRSVMSAAEAEEFTAALGQVFSGGWRLIAHAHRQGIPRALGLTTEQWVMSRLGGYAKLPLSERREAVAELGAGGLSQREIAGVLGVGAMTVNRVLRVPNGTDEDEKSRGDGVFVEATASNGTADSDQAFIEDTSAIVTLDALFADADAVDMARAEPTLPPFAEVWLGEVHPVNAILPDLPPDELQGLADSIAKSGLRHPIMLDQDGVLLDGRQRLRACAMTGVEPRFDVLPEGQDSVAYICSVNLYNTYILPGRRMMIEVLAAKMILPDFDARSDREISAYLHLPEGQIARCRFIMTYAPDRVDSVIGGWMSFSEALAEADEQRKAQGRERDAARVAAERLATLRRKASYVIDDIEEGRLTVEMAWAAWQARP